MKRLLAGVIAGIVLGTTGTAFAAAQVYWHQDGRDYSCQGIASGVICKSGGFDVGITKGSSGFVFVQKHSTKELFACRKWGSFVACEQG